VVYVVTDQSKLADGTVDLLNQHFGRGSWELLQVPEGEAERRRELLDELSPSTLAFLSRSEPFFSEASSNPYLRVIDMTVV
jgi:hypothetical protein